VDAIVLSLLLSKVTVSCHPYSLFGSLVYQSLSYLVVIPQSCACLFSSKLVRGLKFIS
jgi:hypothetical protein